MDKKYYYTHGEVKGMVKLLLSETGKDIAQPPDLRSMGKDHVPDHELWDRMEAHHHYSRRHYGIIKQLWEQGDPVEGERNRAMGDEHLTLARGIHKHILDNWNMPGAYANEKTIPREVLRDRSDAALQTSGTYFNAKRISKKKK